MAWKSIEFFLEATNVLGWGFHFMETCRQIVCDETLY